jgi:hypothetical protein
MPIYLTEFGIQSWPDEIAGVSQARQAEYRSISEHIAYRNARVRGFSQYLMRDDPPRTDADSIFGRYAGFESGLRTSDGKPKVAYSGFRLPLAAIRGARHTTLWGLVRPADGTTRISIDYRNAVSSPWHYLKHDTTNHRGYWTTTTSPRSGRSYRVRWTDQDGTHDVGSPTRAYRGD